VREEFARQADSLSVAPAFTDVEVLEKIRAATSPTKDMQILDLGCGPGIVAAALAPYAGEVVAFDITPEMLEKARQRCQEAGLRNVRFELGRAEELPFEVGSFDAVVTRLTLHHFPDPHRAVAEMVRVTRPHGRVVIADIVSSEDAGEAELHNALETLRDPSHVRAFSTSGLLNLIESPGLRVTSRLTWEMQRDFDEWIRITNAPERVKPLYTVMRTLAGAGIHAGIDLRLNGRKVVFKHRWLLVATEKATGVSAP
jgi:ubiquinone/menaquinone biosynthesis C-methylase UbiE